MVLHEIPQGQSIFPSTWISASSNDHIIGSLPKACNVKFLPWDWTVMRKFAIHFTNDLSPMKICFQHFFYLIIQLGHKVTRALLSWLVAWTDHYCSSKSNTYIFFNRNLDHELIKCIWNVTWPPTWIREHTTSDVWDKITCPFPNFNSVAGEVWECISNFTYTL